LDQENAKKFLLGKAEDKYIFFMKATELARVDTSLRAIADKIDELRTSYHKISGGVSRKEEQVDQLTLKCKEHEKLGKMKLKLMQTQAESYWAYYQAAAEAHQRAEETVQHYKEKAAKAAQNLAEAEQAANDPDDEEAARRNEMEELVKEAQHQVELKCTLETQLRELLAPQKKLERDQHALQKRRKGGGRRLTLAKRRLQEARDKIIENSGSIESEEAKRMASLKETEEELTTCKEKSNETRQAVSASLRAYEELEPHVQDARAKVQNIKNQLGGVQRSIQSLESSSGDSLGVFGPRVKKVYQMVSSWMRDCPFHTYNTSFLSHTHSFLSG
jgi:chromosome segregation ATPase